MDFAIITAYISPIIVLACLCVGYVIKNWVPNEKIDKYIPLIVMVLGIILNFWTCGWVFTLEIALTGAISGLASTGLYEMFTNLLKTPLINSTSTSTSKE